MFLLKNRYKTYNGKLLANIKALKTQKHYINNYKHNFFAFINYNNLGLFMNIKNLSLY